MKPNPFFTSNHFTVPTNAAISSSHRYPSDVHYRHRSPNGCPVQRPRDRRKLSPSLTGRAQGSNKMCARHKTWRLSADQPGFDEEGGGGDLAVRGRRGGLADQLDLLGAIEWNLDLQ